MVLRFGLGHECGWRQHIYAWAFICLHYVFVEIWCLHHGIVLIWSGPRSYFMTGVVVELFYPSHDVYHKYIRHVFAVYDIHMRMHLYKYAGTTSGYVCWGAHPSIANATSCSVHMTRSSTASAATVTYTTKQRTRFRVYSSRLLTHSGCKSFTAEIYTKPTNQTKPHHTWHLAATAQPRLLPGFEFRNVNSMIST